MKRKSIKKTPISEDERWAEYNALKKSGKILEANKLKNEIITSDRWKKPCHHVSGEVN